MTTRTITDMLDREIQKGDVVVYYNNLYIVTEILNTISRIKILLVDKSKTTKQRSVSGREVCLLDKHEAMLWLLKRKKE